VQQVAIGAAVALIAALVGRAVGIIPNPFGGDGPTPTGRVSVLQTLRNQTLKMFRGEATQPTPDEQLGLTLDVQRSSEHASKHGCRLLWTYLDANGPTVVKDPSLVEQEAREVKGDRSTCQNPASIWIPLSSSLFGYDLIQVRVELWDGNTRLASGLSEEITMG
jgi:hypothetical protein